MEQPKRLLSLDILRGADLFLLTVFCPLLLGIKIDADWYRALTVQFMHVDWVGFHLWDLVMPLFMFMSGVTIPFALERYRMSERPLGPFFARLIKRVLLLWLLGMVVQGNLLSFSPSAFKFYSNTLQAIAVGYLVASLAYVFLPRMGRWVLAGGLLLGYWLIFTLVGGSNYGELTNVAHGVDVAVLGGYMDGAWTDEMGVVSHSKWYFYAWIVPSITFVVTVMSGMFAGEVLRSSKIDGTQKAVRLAVAGAVCVALGWAWHALGMPVIKPIWTSSMVLVSTGYCLLLLSGFYYLIDVRGRSKGTKWLAIYGTNSIVAYVLSETPYVKGLARSLSAGLKQYTGDWFPVVVELVMVAVIFCVLSWMYRNKKFLRV